MVDEELCNKIDDIIYLLRYGNVDDATVDILMVKLEKLLQELTANQRNRNKP